MELELRLALTPTRKLFDDHGVISNKRCFAKAFESTIGGGGGGGGGEKLAVSWINGQPNEEDGGNGEKKRTSSASIKNEGEEHHVVGWPPIKSWRKKLLHRHQYCGGCRREKHQYSMALDQRERRPSRGSNSTYVKVKMEGVPIGRKIDLRLYHAYHTLKNDLISMFAKHDHKCNEHYTITYQDQEGDWLLAGDVPWQTFVQSACRLEILINAG